jgi:hypothetical protein
MSRPPSSASTPAQDNLPAHSSPSPVIPTDIRALLGPPPLTTLEDDEAYERILSQMALAISPNDFVEWTWLKDVVDLGWEAGRARRAKAVRIALAQKSAIESILRADWPSGLEGSLTIYDELPSKADQIFCGDDDELESFSNTLARLGLTQQSVVDAAYHASIDDMERLQQLIDNANARRDAILREIDRRRDGLAKRLRDAGASMDTIIDAEFE